MKKLLVIAMILSLGLLESCGKPAEGPSPVPSLGDNDELNPNPGDPGDSNGPVNPPSPPQEYRFRISARSLESSELYETDLPYKTLVIKPWKLNKPTKRNHCPEEYQNRCVKNRQVAFGFPMDAFSGFDPSEYKVKNVYLEGNFYSSGKNYRTELICFLNKKYCSGRGIIKFAGLKIPFLAKTLWWDKDFWSAGYDTVVKNQIFHQKLEGGKRGNKGVYILEDARFDLKELFGMNRVHWHEAIFKNPRLDFVVTDDTYVENPKLIIELVGW